MNVLYQNALAEVDAILQLMEKDLLNKIPDAFMKFIKQKKSKSYIPNLNMDVSLKEQNLLKETDKNITEIATSCGFNHLSYYANMFQSRYGTSPSKYRKLHKRT